MMISDSAKWTHWSTRAVSLALRPRSPESGARELTGWRWVSIRRSDEAHLTIASDDSAFAQREPFAILERGDLSVWELFDELGLLVRDSELKRGEFQLESCDGCCTANLMYAHSLYDGN